MRKHTLKKAVAVFVTAFVLITTILAVNISAEERQVYTLGGKWKWNSDQKMIDAFFYAPLYDDFIGERYPFSQDINFTSAGLEFTNINWAGGGLSYNNVFVWTGGIDDEGWIGDLGRSADTVDFGTTPQVVDKAFYDLFISVATLIEGELTEPSVNNSALSIFTDFVLDFGLSIKTAFNDFTFDAGVPSAEIEVLLSFLVVIMAISVIVAVLNLILKRRKNKL